MYPELTTALRFDPRYVQVLSEAHLDFLIKESELLEGRKGRRFCLRSTDRRVTIALEQDGYEISYPDYAVAKPIYVARSAFADSLVGFELSYGILFTPVLPSGEHTIKGKHHG